MEILITVHLWQNDISIHYSEFSGWFDLVSQKGVPAKRNTKLILLVCVTLKRVMNLVWTHSIIFNSTTFRILHIVLLEKPNQKSLINLSTSVMNTTIVRLASTQCRALLSAVFLLPDSIWTLLCRIFLVRRDNLIPNFIQCMWYILQVFTDLYAMSAVV